MKCSQICRACVFVYCTEVEQASVLIGSMAAMNAILSADTNISHSVASLSSVLFSSLLLCCSFTLSLSNDFFFHKWSNDGLIRVDYCTLNSSDCAVLVPDLTTELLFEIQLQKIRSTAISIIAADISISHALVSNYSKCPPPMNISSGVLLPTISLSN